jgi:hypothetical protein
MYKFERDDDEYEYEYTGEEKRWYSPQMSKEAVFALRRLAWCNKKPMTKMVNQIVLDAFKKLSPAEICPSCKSDRSDCAACVVLVGDEAGDEYPDFDDEGEYEPVSEEQISAQMREHFAIASLQGEAMVSEAPSRGYPAPEEW